MVLLKVRKRVQIQSDGVMLPPVASSEEKKLLSFFNKLSLEDKQTLLKFAQFLSGSKSELDKIDSEPAKPLGPVEPKDIPRPKEESVIKAIKRLNKTYYMLDKGSLFNDISALMTAHLMKGRGAISIIDELESVFAAAYKNTQ